MIQRTKKFILGIFKRDFSKWVRYALIGLLLFIAFMAGRISKGEVRKCLLEMEIERFKKEFIESQAKFIQVDYSSKISIPPKLDSKRAIESYENLKKMIFGSEVHKVMETYYRMEKKFEESISELREILVAEPNNYVLYRRWGEALFQLGRYQEAVPKFAKTIQLRPIDDRAYTGWGDALQMVGRYGEALEKYQIAVYINPVNLDACYNWGAVLDKLGKYNDAIKKYNEILVNFSNDARAYYYLAIEHSKLKQKEKAINNLKKAIGYNPYYKEEAKAEKSFDNLRHDPEFKKLVGE